MLKSSMADLQRQNSLNAEFDKAVSPADQAAAMKADFDRANRMGPVQDQLLQMQLDQLKSGGAATPEQQQRIKEATDAAIAAGNTDIDASTQRGIGLISDELANSRGLRLSDSPMSSEAALLAREGVIQKGSLEKNLRASQAASTLNYPLAVQSLTSGINLAQQGVGSAAQQFQAQLRQQAAQNRMQLFGQSAGSGIGLANVGNGAGSSALSSLSGVRSQNQTKTGWSFDPGAYMTGWGNALGSISKAAGGIGAMMG